MLRGEFIALNAFNRKDIKQSRILAQETTEKTN